jgi:hypothetical protein
MAMKGIEIEEMTYLKSVKQQQQYNRRKWRIGSAESESSMKRKHGVAEAAK